MQNPLSTFSDFSFALICKTQGGVCLEEAEICWQQTFILHFTGDHEFPKIRELVNDNERHLQTCRNFHIGSCWHSFAYDVAVSAIRSSSLVNLSATWQPLEVRPPHCARVVHISARYIFTFKPIRASIPKKQFLPSRDVFCGLESVVFA